MVDRIKITLKNFSGNFDNCKLITNEEYIKHPEKKKYDNYVLRNNTSFDKHDLELSKSVKTGNVIIEGSIRRWHFNDASLLDLKQDSFEKALRNIAKKLNISFEELKKGKITQCEIGLNIKVSIYAIDILPMVVNYSQLDRIPNWEDQGTLYFDGTDKQAKLYAKPKEIADKSSYGKQGQRKHAFERMRIKGNDFLRIEFTLKYQRSFNHHGMTYIRSLADLINNYSDLYYFWAKEANRFILLNKLDYQKKALTSKDKYIIDGLKNLGYEKFLETYKAECEERAKTPNSKKSAKSDANKSVISVLKKYASKDDYNIEAFKEDIKESLFRKSKEEKVDLDKLLAFLD